MKATRLLVPIDGEPRAIPARGLTLETAERWRYHVGVGPAGDIVQIANYFDDNELVGQKIRSPNKEFSVRGSITGHLYGRWLWRDGGRRVIITEGEIDALSVSQVLGHKWPVVSIPNGVSAAKKDIAANLDWLNQFEEVVLCFDNDDPGNLAVVDCVRLFPPGKVKVVRLPLKDPSEMLQAGREGELVQALWNAAIYRPDGIVTLSDVRERVLKPPTRDLRWCFPTLDEATYGRRFGEAVALGAGTGVGKTTLMTQQIAADLKDGHSVAVFAFEQHPAETCKRVAGQMAGKVFHVPNGSWQQEDLEHAVTTLERDHELYLYDHFGSCEWDTVRDRIRFLSHQHGVRIFYLDHLTALAETGDNERGSLEAIMAEIGSLVKELDIWLLFVSHLATPDGAPHEEGGRVKIRHFKGSRAIGFWSHFMMGLERDQQSDDAEDRGKTVLRVLKDRYTGQATGLTVPLSYDPATGLLYEGPQMFDEVTQGAF